MKEYLIECYETEQSSFVIKPRRVKADRFMVDEGFLYMTVGREDDFEMIACYAPGRWASIGIAEPLTSGETTPE